MKNAKIINQCGKNISLLKHEYKVRNQQFINVQNRYQYIGNGISFTMYIIKLGTYRFSFLSYGHKNIFHNLLLHHWFLYVQMLRYYYVPTNLHI